MAARRAPLIKRKTKVARTTRSEQFVINQKHMGGDEPTFTEDLSQIDLARALSWYNYMATTSDARDYLCDYLKNQGRVQELKKMKRVPDAWIPTTLAWTARLISRGFTLPIDAREYVESRLSETLNKAREEVDDAKQESKAPSIQDRVRDRASEILGEVEGLLDDHMGDPTFSFYDWLKEKEIPASYVSKIVDKITPYRDELVEAVRGSCPDLREGYSYLTKKQLRSYADFMTKMVEDAGLYSSNTKKVRVQRKPRVVSVEKKIKNLKYQKEDQNFKVASVSPEKIIGAQELWLFNTKYRTITALRSLDRGGLQVKGTSIVNYDEATSTTRRTGRRTEEIVKRVLDGGKNVLKKVLDGLTESSVQYRVNENTILLRVVSQ